MSNSPRAILRWTVAVTTALLAAARLTAQPAPVWRADRGYPYPAATP